MRNQLRLNNNKRKKINIVWLPAVARGRLWTSSSVKGALSKPRASHVSLLYSLFIYIISIIFQILFHFVYIWFELFILFNVILIRQEPIEMEFGFLLPKITLSHIYITFD